MSAYNLVDITFISCKMLSMNDKDEMRIAAEADCDPRTVASVYEGHPSKKRTRRRIEDAAKKLKLPLPPKEKKS